MFLKVCVWDAELRELRAECFIKEGEPRKAISDLKASSKLKNDNTEAFYKISTLYYELGDHELSLRLVLVTYASQHLFTVCSNRIFKKILTLIKLGLGLFYMSVILCHF